MCPVHLLSFVKTRLYGKYLWQKRYFEGQVDKIAIAIDPSQRPTPFVTVAVSDKQCRSHTTHRSHAVKTENTPTDKTEQVTSGMKQDCAFEFCHFARISNNK